jgi:hypothetical protein
LLVVLADFLQSFVLAILVDTIIFSQVAVAAALHKLELLELIILDRAVMVVTEILG